MSEPCAKCGHPVTAHDDCWFVGDARAGEHMVYGCSQCWCTDVPAVAAAGLGG